MPGKNTKEKKQNQQLRVNLCFNANDPAQKAVYDILSSDDATKSKSAIVTKAVLGMLYLKQDGKKNQVDFSIESIVDRLADNVVEKISKSGISVKGKSDEAEGIKEETVTNTAKDNDLDFEKDVSDFLDMFG